MIFIIKVVPHSQQRYPTIGDWRFIHDALIVTVSDTHNDDYTFLVGIHELIEAYLCKRRGVKEIDVDRFDMEFETNRPADDRNEPGDHKNAPYYLEHQIAIGVERILAGLLGVDWNTYNVTLNQLGEQHGNETAS